MLAWKRGDLLGALQRLWAAFGFAVLVMLFAFYLSHGGPVLAVLGLGLAAWPSAAPRWNSPSACGCSAARWPTACAAPSICRAPAGA